MNLGSLAKSVSDDVVRWRRELHMIPETGTDLPQTAAYVKKVLEELGVEYMDNVGLESAIVATIEGTGEGNGKVVALRADMDALPVIEETGLEYSSTNGNMHACGHDAHTATLLGAVKAFNQIKNEFGGTVRFLFQPAEEISAGAKPMVDAGCLENPDVDYVIGIHVGNISPLGKKGEFLLTSGPMMACLDRFKITVKGKGSHGAYPHMSHDTLVMSAHLLLALQEIISRELDPVEPGVITIGRMQGGSTYNVIPETVELEGTLRAVNEETRAMLRDRIKEISENIARTFRGSADFQYFEGAPPVVNDPEFTERVFNSAREVFGEKVKYMDRPVMGGEDFAYYLKEVPGTFVFLSNPLEIEGNVYPHHNPKFAIDDSYLDEGVLFYLKTVTDLLK